MWFVTNLSNSLICNNCQGLVKSLREGAILKSGIFFSLSLIYILTTKGVLVDSLKIKKKIKKTEEEEITINNCKIPINLSNSD